MKQWNAAIPSWQNCTSVLFQDHLLGGSPGHCLATQYRQQCRHVSWQVCGLLRTCTRTQVWVVKLLCSLILRSFSWNQPTLHGRRLAWGGAGSILGVQVACTTRMHRALRKYLSKSFFFPLWWACTAVYSQQTLVCRYRAKWVGCVVRPRRCNLGGRLAQCASLLWPVGAAAAASNAQRCPPESHWFQFVRCQLPATFYNAHMPLDPSSWNLLVKITTLSLPRKSNPRVWNDTNWWDRTQFSQNWVAARRCIFRRLADGIAPVAPADWLSCFDPQSVLKRSILRIPRAQSICTRGLWRCGVHSSGGRLHLAGRPRYLAVEQLAACCSAARPLRQW